MTLHTITTGFRPIERRTATVHAFPRSPMMELADWEAEFIRNATIEFPQMEGSAEKECVKINIAATMTRFFVSALKGSLEGLDHGAGDNSRSDEDFIEILGEAICDHFLSLDGSRVFMASNKTHTAALAGKGS